MSGRKIWYDGAWVDIGGPGGGGDYTWVDKVAFFERNNNFILPGGGVHYISKSSLGVTSELSFKQVDSHGRWFSATGFMNDGIRVQDNDYILWNSSGRGGMRLQNALIRDIGLINIGSSTAVNAVVTDCVAGGGLVFVTSTLSGSNISIYTGSDPANLTWVANKTLSFSFTSPITRKIDDYAYLLGSSTSKQILVSTDSGSTWGLVSLPGAFSVSASTISVVKFNGKWYASGSNSTSLYESSDNGSSWSSVYSASAAIRQLLTDGENFLFIVSDNGVYTEDLSTFTASDLSITAPTGIAQFGANMVFWNSVYRWDGGDLYRHQYYYSSNGGQNWDVMDISKIGGAVFDNDSMGYPEFYSAYGFTTMAFK